MLIVPLVAAAALASLGPVSLPGSPRAGCQPDLTYRAARPGERLAPRKLNELPGAKAFYSMVHTVDGCPKPVFVGYPRGR